MPVKIFFAILLIFSQCQPASFNDPEKEFLDPPDDTKPWVYWYWIDENISKEGITSDLEAMARVGIGRALIGHISPGTERGEVRILSERWWEMVEWAVTEGQRFKVDIGLFNGPGWSQSGGPWITADKSMRYLVCSEETVTGPGRYLKKPKVPDPVFFPVALQAIKLSDRNQHFTQHKPDKIISIPPMHKISLLADGDTSTASLFELLPDQSGIVTIDFHFKEPVTIQSLRFDYLPVPFATRVAVFSEEEENSHTFLRDFTLDRRNINFQIGPRRFEPVTVSIPSTYSRHFRMEFSDFVFSSGTGFREIGFLSEPRVDNYIEKQLGKMYSDPLPPWNAYLWPEQSEPEEGSVIDPGEIINLTSFIDSTGFLDWQVPEGDWLLLYTGMVPTGAINVPSPPEATGYECDKFSREAMEDHFNSFLGKFLSRVPENERKSLKTVVIDSYEVGSQNWTDGFEQIFLERFGYDPVPWLPVFSGRIVKSADLSNRFLWDVRRLSADLIAENYVGTLRELSNQQGLDLWLENYGHWGFPAEFLQYGGQGDRISGEFWFENPFWDLGPLECRAASSAAHTYGKKEIYAEAFTAGFNFRQYPASMKARGDQMLCEGINHFVLHVYIHQPWEDRKPGVNAWFGMSFQRHNTWFEQSKSWIDYLRRCHYLLQKGEPVTDIAYFIGEDAPRMTGILDPALSCGYDYDFINAEVLMRSDVNDGCLILPHGKKYHLLVLPPQKTMRPELLLKIKGLIHDGALVYGPAPDKSPSMAGYPVTDQKVREMSKEIWGNLFMDIAGENSYGQGRVFNMMELDEVLESLSLSPDVICPDSLLKWTHRKDGDMDIYFISNQGDETTAMEISFRVKNKVPECWDPVTGKIQESLWYTNDGERMTVPIRLGSSGSLFVVFRKPDQGKNITRVEGLPGSGQDLYLPRITCKDDQLLFISRQAGTRLLSYANGGDEKVEINTIPEPIHLVNEWRLYFPAGWDAPDSLLLDSLVSWTELTDDGAQHFSGTAAYKIIFRVPDEFFEAGIRSFLSLGEVQMMAEVQVNGKETGVLWNKPYEADVTGLLKPGENELTIRVTNTWWNRLVGDEKYPQGFPGSHYHQSRTFVTLKGWNAEDDLLRSGLLGPVKITAEKHFRLTNH